MSENDDQRMVPVAECEHVALIAEGLHDRMYVAANMVEMVELEFPANEKAARLLGTVRRMLRGEITMEQAGIETGTWP